MGGSCWFDKESLVGGTLWDAERKTAQTNADLFLTLVSKETISRNGVVQRELRDAVEAAKDRRQGQLYIVPLRLDDVERPAELADYHSIDIFSPDWKFSLARTLEKACSQHQRLISDGLKVAAATRASGKTVPIEIQEEDETGRRDLQSFQYADTGSYWEFVNGELARAGLGRLFEFRRLMSDWPEDRRPSSWERGIREFHRSGDLVSITIGESHYFGGCPYPNNLVETINIMGPTCGLVTIQDLFNGASEAFQVLSAYCNFILSQPGQHFGDGQFRFADIAERHGWTLFEHFNVNERGLILNFSASSGLPHVLGVFEVYVPWESIASHIPGSIRDYLQRCGIPLGATREPLP